MMKPTLLPILVLLAFQLMLAAAEPEEASEKTFRAGAATSNITPPLSTDLIGDLGIAALPFEVFTETGLEIQERSPFKDSFVIELANGGLGHLPRPGSTNWAATKRG